MQYHIMMTDFAEKSLDFLSMPYCRREITALEKQYVLKVALFTLRYPKTLYDTLQNTKIGYLDSRLVYAGSFMFMLYELN